MDDIPVVDGHLDTILAHRVQVRSLAKESKKGHVDVPRMKRGNVQAAVFSLCPTKSKWLASKFTRAWFRDINDKQNGLIQVKAFGDFERARQSGKIGAILHYEGAGCVDKEFTFLETAAGLGLRAICITWMDQNKFGSGAKFEGTQCPDGLTDLGKELVTRAQIKGITIDVSHLNDPGFWDVVSVAKKPIIASHSNCRELCSHPRNLTDDQIKAIGEKKGTIGINFSGKFLVTNWKDDATPITFGVLKRHIDNIASIAGIATVAIGSDFDGTKIPDCLKDCTKFPDLFQYLLNNGYSRQDVNKIAHENLLRVFKATWT
nr:dipeptidase [Candidatus Sigynarchaeota archaeon]